ncbi:MAG TPA: hypothetical protein V6C58_10290 [Allocoleopsis sp.]
MAKWVHSNVLDDGLNYIKTNASKMVLLKAYSAGDNYATVSGNIIATVNMVSGDYTLSSSGSNRVLTTAAGKSDTADLNSGAAPDLHIGFTNGTDTVIWVTDETSDQVITAGNIVNFPQITYTSNQPT